MNPQMEIDDKDKSEFNAAIATLIRISHLKDELAITTINRDYVQKFIVCEAYYMELISIMTTKEIEEFESVYETVKKDYISYRNAIDLGRPTISKSIVDSIVNWEKKLRVVEQKHNLNLLTKQDPRYALSSRR